MSESQADPAPDPAPAEEPSEVPDQEPNHEIADVLASVEDLEHRPVEEHVEVFESAHERLRRALDAPAD